jgi:hypothetical protein
MVKLVNILKEIIKENLPNNVYHFTLPKYLVKILETNKLKADPKFNQISFTTDKDLWIFREFTDEDQEVGVRLTFNSNDLPELKPFIYTGAPGESYDYENEYTSNVGDIPNIKNKIKDITALEYWREYLQSNLPEEEFNKIKFI